MPPIVRLPISLSLKMTNKSKVGIISIAHAAIWNGIAFNAYRSSLVFTEIDVNVLMTYESVGYEGKNNAGVW